MLNSGKKIRASRQKKNILTLVLSEKFSERNNNKQNKPQEIVTRPSHAGS